MAEDKPEGDLSDSDAVTEGEDGESRVHFAALSKGGGEDADEE